MGDVTAPAIAPAPPPRLPQPAKDPAATAQEFEAVYIGQMTKLMMETAAPNGEFSGGHGEEMFRGILAEEMGKEIARRGGVGLAPAVLDQIIKIQGGTPGAR